METFYEWLSRPGHSLPALAASKRTTVSIPAQYNQLFDDELQKLSVSSPEHQQAVERMRGFNWVGYIAKSLRNVGYRDQREVQERTHDIVTKLLTGTLFRNFDEKMHGPLDLRFKRSVANAIRNLVERERNRRRFIPTVSIGQDFQPGGVMDVPDRASVETDEKVIDDFRELVRRRLGEIGVSVLDVRLADGETKSLVGNPSLGSPGKWIIKRTVQAASSSWQGSSSRAILACFGGSRERWRTEEETVAKRRTTTAARQAVGV